MMTPLARPTRAVGARLLAGWGLGVLAAWSAVTLLLTSAWLISRAAEQPPVLYLIVAIVGVRACGIARAAFRYAERLATHDAALRALTDVRSRLYARLEAAGPSALRATRRGDTVQRVTSDVDAVQNLLLRVVLPWSITATVAVGATALVLAISPASGTVLLLAVLVTFWGVPALVGLAGRRVQRTVAPLRGQMSTAVAEAVIAAPDLVAYDATALVTDRVIDADRELRDATRGAAWLEGLGSALIRTTLGTTVCALAWLMVTSVGDGTTRAVLLAVVVLAPIALLEPFDALPGISQQRTRANASVRRLEELADTPRAAPGPTGAGQVPDGHGLVVRGLAARWGGGDDVVDGVDLDLPPGSLLALVGPSGSGKSTVAHVLLKLLEPSAGTVVLGGIDLTDMRGEIVREHVGMLGQDEHVFDTTIAENLRIARPGADDACLLGAIERAGLADFVRSLPRGLDTAVGENGNRLSGGERQRLGLARLLLGSHRVLVLDEPTEHLDDMTAQALLADLLALAPERSILLITHSAAAVDAVVARGGSVVSLAEVVAA